MLGLSLPGDGEALGEPRCREVGMMNRMMEKETSRVEALPVCFFPVIPSCPAL